MAPRPSRQAAGYSRDNFLAAFPERLRLHLPEDWRHFVVRKRWGMLQISFADPRLHYEIWLQTRADLIELGLHLEADAVTNERILQAIAQQALEVREALGARCDLEVWTSTWRRVHLVVPLAPLDDAKLDECAAWLGRCIETLQPVVEGLGRSGRHRRLNEGSGDDVGEPSAGGGIVAAADDDTDEPAATVVHRSA